MNKNSPGPALGVLPSSCVTPEGFLEQPCASASRLCRGLRIASISWALLG